MTREAEKRNMAAARHSMLSPRDSIANRLPILPDPYVVLDADVQELGVVVAAARAPTIVKTPDLDTVTEASEESDTSDTSATISSDSELAFDSTV
jgi:hypothetical protein